MSLVLFHFVDQTLGSSMYLAAHRRRVLTVRARLRWQISMVSGRTQAVFFARGFLPPVRLVIWPARGMPGLSAALLSVK